MTFDVPSLRSVFQSPKRVSSDINHIFDDFFNGFDSQLPRTLMPGEKRALFPQLDVSETSSHYCLELDLPGVNKKDVDIKIDNNILTIKGKKESSKEDKDGNFHARERFCGAFQRSLGLPASVDHDAIYAHFKDGVLRINIPKTEASSAKTIDIKS